MRKALGVNPRSPLLMFLAVRSGKSCKKRPLRISGFPARCLGLRVLLGDHSYLPLIACHIFDSCFYRSVMIGKPCLFLLTIESTHVHLQ